MTTPRHTQQHPRRNGSLFAVVGLCAIVVLLLAATAFAQATTVTTLLAHSEDAETAATSFSAGRTVQLTLTASGFDPEGDYSLTDGDISSISIKGPDGSVLCAFSSSGLGEGQEDDCTLTTEPAHVRTLAIQLTKAGEYLIECAGDLCASASVPATFTITPADANSGKSRIILQGHTLPEDDEDVLLEIAAGTPLTAEFVLVDEYDNEIKRDDLHVVVELSHVDYPDAANPCAEVTPPDDGGDDGEEVPPPAEFSLLEEEGEGDEEDEDHIVKNDACTVVQGTTAAYSTTTFAPIVAGIYSIRMTVSGGQTNPDAMQILTEASETLSFTVIPGPLAKASVGWAKTADSETALEDEVPEFTAGESVTAAVLLLDEYNNHITLGEEESLTFHLSHTDAGAVVTTCAAPTPDPEPQEPEEPFRALQDDGDDAPEPTAVWASACALVSGGSEPIPTISGTPQLVGTLSLTTIMYNGVAVTVPITHNAAKVIGAAPTAATHTVAITAPDGTTPVAVDSVEVPAGSHVVLTLSFTDTFGNPATVDPEANTIALSLEHQASTPKETCQYTGSLATMQILEDTNNNNNGAFENCKHTIVNDKVVLETKVRHVGEYIFVSSGVFDALADIAPFSVVGGEIAEDNSFTVQPPLAEGAAGHAAGSALTVTFAPTDANGNTAPFDWVPDVFTWTFVSTGVTCDIAPPVPAFALLQDDGDDDDAPQPTTAFSGQCTLASNSADGSFSISGTLQLSGEYTLTVSWKAKPPAPEEGGEEMAMLQSPPAPFVSKLNIVAAAAASAELTISPALVSGETHPAGTQFTTTLSLKDALGNVVTDFESYDITNVWKHADHADAPCTVEPEAAPAPEGGFVTLEDDDDGAAAVAIFANGNKCTSTASGSVVVGTPTLVGDYTIDVTVTPKAAPPPQQPMTILSTITLPQEVFSISIGPITNYAIEWREDGETAIVADPVSFAAGTPIAATVVAKDDYDNALETFPTGHDLSLTHTATTEGAVAVACAAPADGADGPFAAACTTDAAGTTVTGTPNHLGTVHAVLKDATDTVVTTTNNAATITAGPAAKAVVTYTDSTGAPLDLTENLPAGTTVIVTMAWTDAAGNHKAIAADDAVELQLAFGTPATDVCNDATTEPTAETSAFASCKFELNTDGKAVLTAQVRSVGSYAATALTGEDFGAFDADNTFAVIAGEADATQSTFVITPALSADATAYNAGTTLTATATLKDTYGNVISTASTTTLSLKQNGGAQKSCTPTPVEEFSMLADVTAADVFDGTCTTKHNAQDSTLEGKPVAIGAFTFELTLAGASTPLLSKEVQIQAGAFAAATVTKAPAADDFGIATEHVIEVTLHDAYGNIVTTELPEGFTLSVGTGSDVCETAGAEGFTNTCTINKTPTAEGVVTLTVNPAVFDAKYTLSCALPVAAGATPPGTACTVADGVITEWTSLAGPPDATKSTIVALTTTSYLGGDDVTLSALLKDAQGNDVAASKYLSTAVLSATFDNDGVVVDCATGVGTGNIFALMCDAPSVDTTITNQINVVVKPNKKGTYTAVLTIAGVPITPAGLVTFEVAAGAQSAAHSTFAATTVPVFTWPTGAVDTATLQAALTTTTPTAVAYGTVHTAFNVNILVKDVAGNDAVYNSAAGAFSVEIAYGTAATDVDTLPCTGHPDAATPEPANPTTLKAVDTGSKCEWSTDKFVLTLIPKNVSYYLDLAPNTAYKITLQQATPETVTSGPAALFLVKAGAIDLDKVVVVRTPDFNSTIVVGTDVEYKITLFDGHDNIVKPFHATDVPFVVTITYPDNTPTSQHATQKVPIKNDQATGQWSGTWTIVGQSVHKVSAQYNGEQVFNEDLQPAAAQGGNSAVIATASTTVAASVIAIFAIALLF